MTHVKTAFLLDGYVDEPACFGVVPYISPYVRYCAGVLAMHGVETSFATCDERREDVDAIDARIADADITIVIMGLTVPGRYRGGSPLTMRELSHIASMRRRGALVLGGPIRSGYALRGGSRASQVIPDGVDFVAFGDVVSALHGYLANGEWDEDARWSYDLADEAAPLGAIAAASRPNFPHVIAELDISRGCDRADGRCSFCTEGASGAYVERGVAGVAREVRALHDVGVRAFRLGRCANILAYGGDATHRGIRPRADRLRELYEAIREVAPSLRVLHTDNCNPATIKTWPDESRDALAVIASHGTDGDGVSLGIESIAPEVVAANTLKVNADEAFDAIKMINEVGSFRRDGGLPALLPGLNFLRGLIGETRDSVRTDEAFLTRLLDSRLAVRRVNIRRAMIFDGTRLGRSLDDGARASRITDRDYKKHRDWVRGVFDTEMLSRVAPDGTAIRDVMLEERVGNVIFGRPLGSYPPLVGVVDDSLAPGDITDVTVCGRGGRSLTAVRRPLDINKCSRAALMALPGVGRARADAIASSRPYRSSEDIKKILDAMDAPGISDVLIDWFRI